MVVRGGLDARVVWTKPSYGGLVGAALGYFAALTPSLLPRALPFLIVVTAIGVVAGYAAGSAIEWFARTIARLDAWYPNKKVTTVSLVVTWGLALVFTPIAVAWQKTQQEALNMPQAVPGSLALAVSAILLGAVLVLIGRCIRAVTRLVGTLVGRIGPLHRWVEASWERIRWIRLAVSLVFVVLLFAGLNAGFSWLTGVYNTTNSDASGQFASNLGVNSGSDASPLPWETLGREGRYYVSNTMSAASIAEITARPAEQPIRLYVGMEQADSFDGRAALAVDELDRVDAWSREYLVIFGVTGTGWVDPDAINALEVVTGGDVTTVATQYSAVPSWIGFIIDSQTTINQNRATIDAVVERWKQLPKDQRPTLVLFGESLGSMGTQGAWTADATPEEVTEDIKSIIWIGPPAESTLWKSWQADRTSGPAWDPVIGDGQITRVLVQTEDPDRDDDTRLPVIVFAAHANDPVVYWRPDLFYREADWTIPPHGPGVMSSLRWFPFITGFQVGMDLISGGAPPEVGHNYSADMAPAVVLGVANPEWNPGDTVRLQEALPDFRYETG